MPRDCATRRNGGARRAPDGSVPLGFSQPSRSWRDACFELNMRQFHRSSRGPAVSVLLLVVALATGSACGARVGTEGSGSAGGTGGSGDMSTVGSVGTGSTGNVTASQTASSGVGGSTGVGGMSTTGSGGEAGSNAPVSDASIDGNVCGGGGRGAGGGGIGRSNEGMSCYVAKGRSDGQPDCLPPSQAGVRLNRPITSCGIVVDSVIDSAPSVPLLGFCASYVECCLSRPVSSRRGCEDYFRLPSQATSQNCEGAFMAERASPEGCPSVGPNDGGIEGGSDAASDGSSDGSTPESRYVFCCYRTCEHSYCT